MTDEYDALRRALSLGAADAPTEVDPAAARRAGDARQRTKTAVTTSMAFSLVIFAGLGSVYFAAHRSRPSSLGSDVVTSTPAASPSASPSPIRVTAGFLTRPVIAGRPDVLHISGPIDFPSHYVISWGDGTTGGADEASFCTFPEPNDGTTSVDVPHTYVAAGMQTVVVTTFETCGEAPGQTASFKQPVSADVVAPPAAVPPAIPPTPTGLASASPKASPTTTPDSSASPSPSGTPVTPTASPSGSPVGSRSPQPGHSPSPSASAVRSASATRSASAHATASGTLHA